MGGLSPKEWTSVLALARTSVPILRPVRKYRGFSVVLACLLVGSTINAGAATAADPAPPDVAVAITAGDFIAGNNGNGLWKVQVSNPTTTPLAGPITATVTVPSPVSLDTEVGSTGWRCTGVGTTTATCTLDQGLGANAPAPLLQLPAVLPQGVTGTTTVSAQISAATGILPATVTASATGEATITPMPTPTPPPVDPAKGVDLGIDAPYTKTLLGKPVTQEIRVYNSGDVASTGPTTVTVKVTDATFRNSRNDTPGDGWDCTYDYQTPLTLICVNPRGVPAGGELPPLTIATRELATPLGGPAPERVRFDLSVSSPSVDIYPRDNSTVALPLVVAEANIRLTKYLSYPANPAPGSRLYYYLDVESPNRRGLKGPFVIEDQLPVGMTFVSGSQPWVCTLDPTRGPAGTVRCVLTGDTFTPLNLAVDLSEETQIGAIVTNTATISSATPELDFTDNTTTAAFEVMPPVYSMAITKTGTRFDYSRYRYYSLDNEPMKWFVQVYNTSNVPIKGGVVVTDTLPAGLSYVGVVGDGWSCSANTAVPPTVTCTHPATLINGEGADFYLLTQTTAPTTQPETPFTNTASVSTVRDPAVTLASDTATSWLYWTYDIAVTKSAPYPFYAGAGGSTTFSQIGQLITGSPAWNVWRITLTNNTNRPITQHGSGFSVVDTLPAGSTFVGTLTGQWCTSISDGVISCQVWDDIPVGESITIDIVATVPADTPAGTVISNNVALEWTYDNNATNNSASASTPVLPIAADLTLHKSEGIYDAATGTVTYDLFVTNNGPSNYAGPIRVIDNLPMRTDGTGHLVVDSVTVGPEVQGTCATSATATQETVTCDLTTAPVMLTGIDYKVATIVTTSSNTTDPLQNFGRNCISFDWTSTSAPIGNLTENDSSCTTGGVAWDQTIKLFNLGISKSTSSFYPVWDVYSGSPHNLYAVVAGQEVGYHIVVKNSGREPWDRTIPVQDVFTSSVPLEFISATGGGFTCAPSGFTNTTPAFTPGMSPTLTCQSETDLPVDAEIAFDVVVKTTTNQGLDNTASLASDDGYLDSDWRDDSATVQIRGSRSGGPAITKEFVAGGTSTSDVGVVGPSGTGSFYLHVYAYGDYVPTPLTLTDTIPDGFTITGIRQDSEFGTPADPMDCTTAGQQVTCTLTGHPLIWSSSGWLALVIVDVTWTGLSAGNHVNTAYVTDGLGRSANDSVTVRLPAVDLGIVKSSPVGQTEMPVGSIVPFTIVVTNGGATPWTDTMTVTDYVDPYRFDVISISGEGWSCTSAPNVVCVSNQDLPVGGRSTPVNIVTRMKEVGGFNEARLIPPDADLVPWNDYSMVSIRGTENPPRG